MPRRMYLLFFVSTSLLTPRTAHFIGLEGGKPPILLIQKLAIARGKREKLDFLGNPGCRSWIVLRSDDVSWDEIFIATLLIFCLYFHFSLSTQHPSCGASFIM
jgi:hypothetical protein